MTDNNKNDNKKLLALLSSRVISADYLGNFNEIILTEYKKFIPKNFYIKPRSNNKKYKNPLDYDDMTEQEICRIFDNILRNISNLVTQ